MYDCDSNYIKGIAMKTRETSEMVRCYTECYDFFKAVGFTARLLRLDNEVSRRLIKRIEEDGLDYQLAAPGDHRQNPAERAIQDYKNHFISVLAGVDPTFPRNRWDQLLGHVETTINLSRPSKINPKVSAYTIINGQFDYNKTPLAPAGMKAIAHVTTNNRTTWGPHGESGWIVGSAPKHFRCWKVLIKRTKKVRTSNTVNFFPVKCGNPLLTEAE